MRHRSFLVNKCLTTKGLFIFYLLLFITSISIFFKIPKYSTYYNTELSLRTSSNSNNNQEVCQEIFRIQEELVNTLANKDLKFFTKLNYEENGEKSYIWYAFYYLLSKFIPSVIPENVFAKDAGSETNYTIPKQSRLDRMKWKIPYLPCRLREYSGEDVHTCIHKRSLERKRFQIAYIGDSRVRRPMEYLLELLQHYNLTITTYEGSTLTLNQFFGDKGTVLWSKYKQKLTVQSSMLPTFHIDYAWAPMFSRGDSEIDNIPHLKYREEKVFSSVFPRRKTTSYVANDEYYIKILKGNGSHSYALRHQIQTGKENGALDELKRLLKKNKEDIPDLILIDTSAWLLTSKELPDILYNIDKWAISGTLKLHRIIKQLADQTTVIVLLPSPLKDGFKFYHDVFTYFDIQSNQNQQWYLNAQIQMLPRNVMKWDSFIPVAFAANEDCYRSYIRRINVSSLPTILRFDYQNSYSCESKVHSGYEAIGIAVQMLLNQICNKYMERNSDRYCCES